MERISQREIITLAKLLETCAIESGLFDYYFEMEDLNLLIEETKNKIISSYIYYINESLQRVEEKEEN